VSLDCPFLIVPSIVFNVYLFCNWKSILFYMRPNVSFTSNKNISVSLPMKKMSSFTSYKKMSSFTSYKKNCQFHLLIERMVLIF